MNEEDNETLKYFKKVYDELMQDEKYQKYASLMDFYHKKVEDLQYQLEEKDKVIDEAIEYLIKWGKQPDADLYYCINEHKEYTELLEILERGKNVNITN